MQKDMRVGIRTRYYFKYQGLYRIFYFNFAAYGVFVLFYLFFCLRLFSFVRSIVHFKNIILRSSDELVRRREEGKQTVSFESPWRFSFQYCLSFVQKQRRNSIICRYKKSLENLFYSTLATRAKLRQERTVSLTRIVREHV